VSGLVVSLPSKGQPVKVGETIAILESMKMEIAVESSVAGEALEPKHSIGDSVNEGDVIVKVRAAKELASVDVDESPVEHIEDTNESLTALNERLKMLQDEARPDAVARRRSRGQLTARECLDRLCDADSFREYGGLAVAAQRRTKKIEELIAKTPADGVITGVGSIEGVESVIIAVDATILAGTQGFFQHQKIDRAVEVATKQNLPIVVLPEGGGGRPNDTDVDNLMCAGLHLNSWTEYSKLAGVVPRVAFVSGYCFAGSAAIAGTSDVVIATKVRSERAKRASCENENEERSDYYRCNVASLLVGLCDALFV